MDLTSSRAAFCGEERLQPLIISVPSPPQDLLILFRRAAVPGTPSFLLESGRGPERIARYSFFGSDPYLVLTGWINRYEVRTGDRRVSLEGLPFSALTGLVRNARMVASPSFPPFLGGGVGYFSYDAVRWFERLPHIARQDLSIPDMQFAFYEIIAAYDHRTGWLHLIYVPSPERWMSEPREKLYREGCDRLAAWKARLAAPDEGHISTDHLQVDISPGLSRADYVARVRQCQDYIRAGDIYQANLSHRFCVDGVGPSFAPVELYTRLRALNPSPFAGLLTFDELSLVSCSPERLVSLRGRRAETRPIAGTRPRGQSPDADRRLTQELKVNPKERAEHVMLVDLERNDLGRVARYGSVHVDEFMTVEGYSHVSHLVSNVTANLRDDSDGLDLFRAMFPGGTITGVPKIRCMEIIEELEPVRRGPYTGSFGYLSWTGDLDFNIIIRTLVIHGGRGFVQVGAGIVADSQPELEYEETLHKAEALMQALRGSTHHG